MRKHRTFSGLLAVLSVVGALAFTGGVQAQSDSKPLQSTYDSAYSAVGQRYIGTLPQGWHAYEHKFDGSIASGADLERALTEALASLGDKGVNLLSPKEVEQLKARLASGFVGVGVSLEEIAFISRDLLIEEVFTDSTAEAAGIKAGDRILAVNGRPIKGATIHETTELISGKPGSQVILTIERAGAIDNIAVARDLDDRIGISIKLDKPSVLYKARWVQEGAPAAQAGLAENDVITAVDGVSVDGLKLDDVLKRIGKGTIGSTVKVSFLRDKKSQELTITRGIVRSWDNSFGLRAQSGGYPDDNWSKIDLKNFDWNELVKLVDDLGEEYLKYPNIILDLSGANGNDAEIAARVAARFLNGDGRVLVVKERVGGVEQLTTYEVLNGELLKKTASGTSTVVEKLPANKIEGKLVVVVDDETSGAAAAVAHALQHAGRAKVVGFSSDDRNILTSHLTFGETVIAVPTGTLQSLNGGDFDGVSPDRRVYTRGGLEEAARSELSGRYWYNDPVNLVMTGFCAIMVLILGLLFLKASRSNARAAVSTSGGTGTTDGGKQVACCTVDDEEEVEDKDNTPPPTGIRRWWPLLMIAGMLVLMFGLPNLLMWKFNGAPAGTTAKIVVETYVDGGELSALQTRVIDELKAEYTGDIEFKIIDVREHPEVTKSYDGRDFGAVTHVPAVRTIRVLVDKDGKETSRGWQMGGAATKRSLVGTIESMANNTERFWPAPKIERHKK